MVISGNYHAFVGVLEEELCSTLHATYPLEYQGKRIYCKDLIPVYPKGLPIILDGEMCADEFAVTCVSHETNMDIIKEFLVKGKYCTGKEADNLFRLFSGTTVWHVRDDDKPRLMQEFISEEHAESLICLFEKIAAAEEEIRTLASFNFSPAAIETFYRHNRHLTDLFKNPYAIGYECQAQLSWCDKVALYCNEHGLNPVTFHRHSKERLQYILRVTIDYITSLGHTYVTPHIIEEYIRKKSWSIEMETADPDVALLFALSSKALTLKQKGTGCVVYLTGYLQLEDEATAKLKGLSSVSLLPVQVPKSDIANYDPQQQAAICGCLSEAPIHILTGGPGTGKTTTTRAIVQILEKHGQKVLLCAPTGRASVRIKESTGHTATTIHRMLGIRGVIDNYTATYNEDHPLMCDAVIVDEVSMLGLDLFVSLLRAVPSGCRVILVGDEEQLPSISPGAILHDLMVSRICPVYRLTNVHRQANGSSIVDNAYNVLAERTLYSDVDFEILNFSDRHEAMAKVLEIYQAHYTPEDPYHLQILCPCKVGKLGIKKINQEILALDPRRVPKRGQYAVGDKVMTITNRYEMPFQYMNGDIGIIEQITEDMITVRLSSKKNIYVQDLQDLQHAYAATIHKSQGSEYDHVVLVMDMENKNMLYKNLLYTAITRAKHHVTVININDAVTTAMHRKSPERFSGLAEKITVPKTNAQAVA